MQLTNVELTNDANQPIEASSLDQQESASGETVWLYRSAVVTRASPNANLTFTASGPGTVLVSIKEVSDPDDMDAPAADTDDGEDWTTQTYEVAADDVGTPTTMYGIVRFPYDSDTEDCRFHVRITTA